MLLEIYILNGSAASWTSVLNHLELAGYAFALKRDGTPIEASEWRPIFQYDQPSPYHLAVTIGRQEWTTGFYSSEFIDFQCNAEGIRSVHDIELIREFMGILFHSTGQRVILVPETLHPNKTRPLLEVPN